MLPKTGEYLVITKSLKDVMTLYQFGISAVAPISENTFISDTQMASLTNRFKTIVMFYDNDRPGLRAMINNRKKFPNLIPLWIPWKYKAKDISDFYAKYKKDKLLSLIEKAKSYVKEKCETF
ncbi:MAG: toprim domain-containing protein [Bacteroidales bacterium]|nr:toprim domain-containing protein [Candidatus Scybalousia scybalohippi]